MYILVKQEKTVSFSLKKTAIYTVLIFGMQALAQNSGDLPSSISLKTAIENAMTRPSSMGAQSQIDSAIQSEEITRRQLNRPIARLQSSYNIRNKAFDLETPIGAFQLGEKTGYQVDVNVIQPIFKPGGKKFLLPALEQDTQAAVSQKEQVDQQNAREAAFSFFDLLSISAQIESAGRYVQNLQDRLLEAEANEKVGRILHTERMKVQMGLLKAKQHLNTLQELEKTQQHKFQRAIHSIEPLQPEWDLSAPLPELPSPEVYDEVNILKRPEIKTLSSLQKSLNLQEEATHAERLPELNGIVRYSHSNGETFSVDSLWEARLQLTWKPFEAGTRGARQAKLRAESNRLGYSIEELKTGVALQLEACYSQLVITRGRITVAEEAVELARETVRVERERFRNQRATTNDLLEQETLLFQEETTREVEKLNYLKKYFDFFYTAGIIWSGV